MSVETSGARPQSSSVSGVREVAALAGVSVGTVSNVLNRPENVSEATRARVESAMKDLGFVGSRAAGQLRSKKSHLVGVVVPDVGNPFWATVLRGIERVLDEHDLTMIVSSTRQDRKRQKHVLAGLLMQGVDGLVIAPIADRPKEWAPLSTSRYGVVTLEKLSKGTGGRWVSADNVKGARLAAGYLLDRGHRRIGMINGPEFVSWCAERRQGVVDAIRERGLDPDEVLVLRTVSDLTVEEGRRAASELVGSGTVTAVFCVNDMLALGALVQANDQELRVPQDVSIMGYDDVDFASALSAPLTTIRQPAYEIGKAAARLLISKTALGVEEHVEFTPELIERASVASVEAGTSVM